MSGDRVLVTGATGYLGGRLTAAFSDSRPLGGDVTDPQALARAFAAAGPATALIHLAAADEATCADDFARGLAVNVLGTRNVLDAAAAAGVRRIIFMSTFHVYGDPAEGAIISEATLPDPLRPYGITKLVGEQLCKAAARKHGFELAIVRLSNGMGAPANAARAPWVLVFLDLCRQAHEKRALTLRSSGLQGRDFLSIDDVGRALRLLLTVDAASLREPVFNLGSGVSVRIRDIAGWVQEEYRAMYGEAVALSAPEPAGPPPALLRYDIEKIGRLGFTPRTDLRAEIRKILEFCERFRMKGD